MHVFIVPAPRGAAPVSLGGSGEREGAGAPCPESHQAHGVCENPPVPPEYGARTTARSAKSPAASNTLGGCCWARAGYGSAAAGVFGDMGAAWCGLRVRVIAPEQAWELRSCAACGPAADLEFYNYSHFESNFE